MEPGLGPEAAALHTHWLAKLLLGLTALSCSLSSPASPAPSLVPRVRTTYNLGRTFLGLDKCNACIGTSICKKFFKEEIRFDNSLASHLELPSEYLPSYPANYSDDSKTWRTVEISRLISRYQNEVSDMRICASISAPKTCSIERVLRKTERFQKWLRAKRLTPDLVQTSTAMNLHTHLAETLEWKMLLLKTEQWLTFSKDGKQEACCNLPTMTRLEDLNCPSHGDAGCFPHSLGHYQLHTDTETAWVDGI